MGIESLTAAEGARLGELWSYAAVGTYPEPDFDQIVRLTATICRAPVAAVSLVDADRIWFKAKLGLEADEINRDGAFCDVVVTSRAPLAVPDATQDVRFSSNPLVCEVGVRAYLGYPLKSPSGAVLGSLCVVDTVPRPWGEVEHEAVRVHTAQIMALLELRRTYAELTQMWEERREIESQAVLGRRNDQRRMAAELHDGLGQDLTGMALLLKVVRSQSSDATTREELLRIEKLMRSSIDTCRRLAREQTAFGFLHGSLRASLDRYLDGVNEMSNLRCELQWEKTVALRDRAVAYNVYRIVQEAVTNAVRHSGGSRVVVIVSMLDGRLRADIEDDGLGLRGREAEEAGVGLETMKYRATALGGRLQLQPKTPRGLRVRCEIPIPHKPSGDAVI